MKLPYDSVSGEDPFSGSLMAFPCNIWKRSPSLPLSPSVCGKVLQGFSCYVNAAMTQVRCAACEFWAHAISLFDRAALCLKS